MPTALPATDVRTRPRVLIVDDEPGLVEVVGDVVGGLDCTVTVAKTLAQARRKLSAERFELLVVDVNLPDGDGTTLLPALRRHNPTATAIVITGSPSMDGAITALRGGAVDFVPKPFTHDALTARVRRALDQQQSQSRQQKRVVRLREAVKRLGVARRTVNQKVDLLCNDLVGAYSDLAKQVDEVRIQESFRKQIEQATDLEQLLCHTMDWMLGRLGHANVALWLAAEDGEFQLGAYMKHTIDGGDAVAEVLRTAVIPAAVRDGFAHVRGSELRGLKKDDRRTFQDQDLMTLSATYLGESLAAVVFFRETPFTEPDEATLKAIGPVFATALATVVRDPSVDTDPGSFMLEDGDKEADTGHKKEDWWKRGEPPPY